MLLNLKRSEALKGRRMLILCFFACVLRGGRAEATCQRQVAELQDRGSDRSAFPTALKAANILRGWGQGRQVTMHAATSAAGGQGFTKR